jgi:hypothetical protein
MNELALKRNGLEPEAPLSERIILLVSLGTVESFSQAVGLLNTAYPDRPDLAATAYELACLVVGKRCLRQKKPAPVERINTRADLVALSAAKDFANGNLAGAFTQLKIAVMDGARVSLCRAISFAVLRSLERADRMQVLTYSSGAVESIEIGNVRGTGLLLVSSAGQPCLRSCPEVEKDAATGAITPHNLGATDWRHYLSLVRTGTALSNTRWAI